MHHPWERFSRLTAWSLKWDDLPDGVYGHTDHETRTVTIATGLSQAERRSTICHETLHIVRGPVEPHHHLREELAVDRLTARMLMPSLAKVIDALCWARGNIEDAADELWVDDLLLHVRLSALHAGDRAYLDSRLGEVLL